MIAIGDVIELSVDIPEQNLRAGDRGTVVHCHNQEAYEIEFTNENGETLNFLSLSPDQFIVVWKADTEQWVPVVEQVAALTTNLPDDSAREVLDFARFLSVHRRKKFGAAVQSN
jgi:hypothetical protein